MKLPPAEELLANRVERDKRQICEKLDCQYGDSRSFQPTVAPDILHNLSIYADQLLSIITDVDSHKPPAVSAKEAIFLACKVAELAQSPFNTPKMTQDPRRNPMASPSERVEMLHDIVRRYKNHFPVLGNVTAPYIEKLETFDDRPSEPQRHVLRSMTTHAFLGIEIHNVHLYEAERAFALS